MIASKRFLNFYEAAQYLGVSDTELRNLEDQKKVRFRRNPMTMHKSYKKDDLDNLLSSSKPW